MTPNQAPPDSVTIGRATYTLSSATQLLTACLAVPTSAHIESVKSDDKGATRPYSFHSWLITSDSLKMTANLDIGSCTISSCDAKAHPVPSRPHCVLAINAQTVPFILDLGASIHISPERSDFKSLRPIDPHPIEGFNGSSTNAVGVGNIELCIGSEHKILLHNILFMPSCSARLISVPALTQDTYNFVLFGPEDCYVTDCYGKVLVQGIMSSSKSLYVLNCPSTHVTRPKLNSHTSGPSQHPTVLYSKSIPKMLKPGIVISVTAAIAL